jgi:transcriptional regulator GlxA family with amidase domain
VKWQEQLIGVVLHQLRTVRMVPLQLPHLSDRRVVRLTDILVGNPSDARTLAQLCRVVGASKRSIERLFQQEVGMTFGKWRQQLRLMQGIAPFG